jgi:hypothetical protein
LKDYDPDLLFSIKRGALNPPMQVVHSEDTFGWSRDARKRKLPRTDEHCLELRARNK